MKKVRFRLKDGQTSKRSYNGFQDVTEFITKAVDENTVINREANTISGICAFRPVSENGRIYKEKAVKSLLSLMNGTKAFRNHAGMFSGSAVEDLLGEHVNPRRHSGAIYTDLQLLETAQFKDILFDIAENKPHLAGFSINARGKFANEPDENGREVVEDITHLYSVDFVGNPATTNGMFEEADYMDTDQADPNDTDKGGVAKMDRIIAYLEGKIKTAGLTESGIVDGVLEYLKTLENGNQTKEDTISTLNSELKEAQTQLETLQTANEELQEAHKDVTAKLQVREAADAAASERKAREELIATVMKEHKLEKMPEALYSTCLTMQDYDGKTAEERITAVVKDLKTVPTAEGEANMDTSAGDEQTTEEQGNKPKSLEEARKIISGAFTNSPT